MAADPRPAAGPAPGAERDLGPSACCVHLRCKSLYYRDDERPGRLHASTTMDYWCGRTNADLGPDRHAATHGGCQPGRGCFEGDEGPALG